MPFDFRAHKPKINSIHCWKTYFRFWWDMARELCHGLLMFKNFKFFLHTFAVHSFLVLREKRIFFASVNVSFTRWNIVYRDHLIRFCNELNSLHYLRRQLLTEAPASDDQFLNGKRKGTVNCEIILQFCNSNFSLPFQGDSVTETWRFKS